MIADKEKEEIIKKEVARNPAALLIGCPINGSKKYPVSHYGKTGEYFLDELESYNNLFELIKIVTDKNDIELLTGVFNAGLKDNNDYYMIKNNDYLYKIYYKEYLLIKIKIDKPPGYSLDVLYELNDDPEYKLKDKPFSGGKRTRRIMKGKRKKKKTKKGKNLKKKKNSKKRNRTARSLRKSKKLRK